VVTLKDVGIVIVGDHYLRRKAFIQSLGRNARYDSRIISLSRSMQIHPPTKIDEQSLFKDQNCKPTQLAMIWARQALFLLVSKS
jgi:hypothetical protein